MFNVGLSELLIIFLIAFLVVGPKDLPKVARWLGRQFRNFRLLIKEVKSEFAWEELEKDFNDTRENINQEIKQLNSDADISKEVKTVSGNIEDSTSEINQALKKN